MAAVVQANHMLFRLIQRDTAYLLQHVLRPNPDQPIVLVTAPTGSAAYNINGSTIHSALSINDRTKAVLPYEKTMPNASKNLSILCCSSQMK